MTKPIYELSMDVDCDFSGLPEATCSHCRGDDLGDMDSKILHGDFERSSPIFLSQFGGTCVLDRGHRIKKGDKVCKVQHADNPLVPVSGVACTTCTLDLPRAK